MFLKSSRQSLMKLNELKTIIKAIKAILPY